MKYLILAAALLATPAMAQQAPANMTPPSASDRAAGQMLMEALQSQKAWMTAAIQGSDQIKMLQDQVAALTKERDDLKAKMSPVADATSPAK